VNEVADIVTENDTKFKRRTEVKRCVYMMLYLLQTDTSEEKS
jgi:hypothetical protein